MDEAIQLELSDRQIKSRMKTALKMIAGDMSMELPELPDYCNELDKKLNKLRRMRMDNIVAKAEELVKQVEPTKDFKEKLLLLLEKGNSRNSVILWDLLEIQSYSGIF